MHHPLHRSAYVPQRTFLLTCGVFLATGVILAGLGPALPRLAVQVGHAVATLGSLFTALSAGIVLSQFAAGPASDRFGQRRVLAVGMLLMGSGALGISVSPTLLLLLLAALVAGSGFGCVLIAGNVLIARLFATRSAAALNGLNLFFGIGAMIGPALAGLFDARLHLPQAVLWVGAGLVLGLAPLVLWLAAFLPPPDRNTGAMPRNAPRPVLLWLLGFLLLVYTGTEVGFGGWVTLYMMTGAELSPLTAALAASGFWIALTSGRAIGAALGLRLNPHRLLVICLAGALVGALLLITGVGSGGRSLVGVLVFGLSCGPIFPTIMALVTTLASGNSTAAGLVLALGNTGSLIIPALLGLLLTSYGAGAAAGLILTVTLIMLMLGTAIAGDARRAAFA